MPAQVLAVCTGNWHRSPIIEHLLRERLASLHADGITVRSAGTIARPGVPMPPETLDVLAERGMDGSGFRTTHLDESAVHDVDLLIAAARDHRAAAVGLRPALLNRAFTLFELARICRQISPSELTCAAAAERLLELVPLAAGRRTHSLPEDPADDDLPDPIGQPRVAFERCADAVSGALDAIVGLFAAS